MLGEEKRKYKFIWIGSEKGDAGVGVLIAEKWLEKLKEVKRVNERILLIRVQFGKSMLNLISVYAPQVGRPNTEKEDFWATLLMLVCSIREEEEVLIGGDIMDMWVVGWTVLRVCMEDMDMEKGIGKARCC
jgi:exonuclease III